MVFIGITAFIVVSIPIILKAYRAKRIKHSLAAFAKSSLNILFPLISLLLKILKNNKDTIRRFYIDINNILTESAGIKCKPDDLMLILPHCLQNFECKLK
jgi:hypothetical protein